MSLIQRAQDDKYWEYPSCEHDYILCFLIKRNGVASIKEICKLCGHACESQKLSKYTDEEKEQMHQTTQEKLDLAREKYRTQLNEKRDIFYAAKLEEQKKRDAQWWREYNEYLSSPEWHRKRALVFERDNYLCQGCYSNSAELVHHLSYKHVGEEFLFELTSMCELCHDRIHAEPKNN